MNALDASRLPDLPNAGYVTPKEKATSDLIMFWLRAVERDRPLLLSIVVDGAARWRKVAGDAWHLTRASRSTAVTTELLDRVFDYMALLAGPNPAEQLLILLGHLKAQERTRWDKRSSTQRELTNTLRNAVADLRKYGPSHG